MEFFEQGSLVKSKAGHDRDGIFVVTRVDGQFVEIADGKNRRIDKPKRKKKKHLQPILYQEEKLAGKFRNGQPVRDEDIQYALKMYRRL